MAGSSSFDYDNFETVSSELYDLDTEQSQARYDPRVLSKELLGTSQHHTAAHSGGDGSDDEQSEDEASSGAHCVNAHHRYEHGEKVCLAERIARSFICLRAVLIARLTANNDICACRVGRRQRPGTRSFLANAQFGSSSYISALISHF